jgi:branched-chain amino acid transport system ATP-binding protein
MIDGEAALRVEDIHTYYGSSYVLQGVSLDVRPGTIAAVLGRNGVGKTTLIRSIMGFTPPRAGRIEHNGDDITSLATYRIVGRGIGLVPQGRRIFPSLTVHEHLVVAARTKTNGDAGWNERSVFEFFPRLLERRHNKAGTLSGGEQQMLAVARALVSNPNFLLLDEPTEGLSPFLVEELAKLLVRLRKSGLSALLIEQNVAFAVAVADRVFVMEKGRIALECTPSEIANDQELILRYLAVT